MKGNPGGPGGNPHGPQVQKLRAALFAAVTEEDLHDVVAALVRAAKEGNVQAARELLSRVLGPAEAIDVLERLEALEERLEGLKGARGEYAA